MLTKRKLEETESEMKLVGKILDGVNSPEDIRKLDNLQLEQLAHEMREFLIDSVSRTGGHLASNLGVVELTLSIHKVFDTSIDKVVWDVGHQAYIHKILTGRKEEFCTLRQYGGISGFPKVNESLHDCFNTGHSSTSISAALGIARARDINNDNYSVIAVIGDGALTGGMAFEALNDAGRSPNNIIVILNDNEMSIAKNVGGLSSYLSKLRTQPLYFKAKEDIDLLLNKIPAIGKPAARALHRAKGTIKYMIMPGIIFEDLGFKYFGPVDGHNMNELSKVLSRAKLIKGPVLLHVCTQKGRGYTYAEKEPQQFHGISPFEIETGEVKKSSGPTYSHMFGQELIRIAQKDRKVVAVTAAMPHGTGLEGFSKAYPDRFFDVGIAEQHAVTLSAGMASNGLKPVVAVYSSFLQRAYDQIMHDIALQNLHVVIAVDRAGIVGEDGETHQGVYDLSFLGHIPNMTIMAPSDYSELASMLEYAIAKHKGPIALRYPRGAGCKKIYDACSVKLGKGVVIRDGKDVAIAAIGNMVETALKAAGILEKAGISACIINARFIKPLDEKLIMDYAFKTKRLVTLEDNAISGGFGSRVLEFINNSGLDVNVKLMGFPDEPVVHGSRNKLFKKYGLDADSIAGSIMKWLRTNKAKY